MKYLIYLLLAVSAFGQTTPNLHLNIPPQGTANFEVLLNQNFSILDGQSVSVGIAVDGIKNASKYPLTPAGIQAAINQAQTNGCGFVFLPPTEGIPIAMGGTQITIPSCVKVSGAGMGQTVLQWTSNLASGAVGMTSTVKSYLGNLTLSFNSGNTSDAIRMIATDAAPAEFNTIENIYIDFSALGGSGLGGAGSSGIHASGVGGSLGTDIVLNAFHNISMNAVDHAVVCNDCEGNHWQIIGQNLGAQSGSALFWETGFNADEQGDLRIESGSGNPVTLSCLNVSGSTNQFRLTCDGNFSTITAISGDAGWNEFHIGTAGPVTLGSPSSNSTYTFESSSIGLSISHNPQINVINPLIFNTPPTIASGFGTSPSIVNSNGTAVFEVNVGTGGSATSGVLTMPTASVGWSCQVTDMNTNDVTRETAFTTTSVTLTAASAWTASDKLLINCGAF
jgi:hypothetical protein